MSNQLSSVVRSFMQKVFFGGGGRGEGMIHHSGLFSVLRARHKHAVITIIALIVGFCFWSSVRGASLLDLSPLGIREGTYAISGGLQRGEHELAVFFV